MNHLTNFLNSTNLTAGQQIIVSTISAFVMVVLTPIFMRFYKSTNIKLVEIVKPIKYKYLKYKRLKKGKLSMSDYIEIEKKIESGQSISKVQMEAYEKEKLKYEESIKKLSETISSLSCYRFPKL